MEKLEAALAKARLNRQATEGLGANTAPRPRAPVGQARNDGAWQNLPEVTITPEHARQGRIVATLGGRDAIPYDMLRSRTVRLMKDSQWRRLAITSPNASCGKTTLSLNLALSLARQRELKILLIDLDLRRPALHKLLGYKPAKSMHQFLEGSAAFEDCAARYGENLLIGMNAAPSGHPAEILHSSQARDQLAALEGHFAPDITIFDMSPMLASDDNVGFMANVDCALLVAAAESTTLNNIDICEKELAQLTNVLGVVLNKCRYQDTSSGYGYEAYE